MAEVVSLSAEEAPRQTSKSISNITNDTSELVIGLIGPVGAGVTTTTGLLKTILENEYGYKVRIIRARDLIRKNADKVDFNIAPKSGADEIMQLQELGTKLRTKFGDEYLAAKAVELIALEREKEILEFEKSADGQCDSQEYSFPRRTATIIDSLKHREETELLRGVYGGAYWQFTVFAPETIREKRLKIMGVDRVRLRGIFTTDDDAGNDHGQQVSKAAYLSDFFVRNDHENKEHIENTLKRYLELLFNISVHTPGRDEAGMYAAVSAAAKSACLSRQVGAALYSRDGELISIGWNDVPKYNGGLYETGTSAFDNRCYKWREGICHNDQMKNELYQQIFDQLKAKNLLKADSQYFDVQAALAKTPVKGLIEYSRSIHAEMEAIVSASRLGKPGMVGGTLYTTTFPCHNCARHIVAAGISTVYYVEPYSKSLALRLHDDTISIDGTENDKVLFLQYDGVGPRSMPRLFQHQIERKDGGKAITRSKKEAMPVLPPPTEGFPHHEGRVIKRIKEVKG